MFSCVIKAFIAHPLLKVRKAKEGEDHVNNHIYGDDYWSILDGGSLSIVCSDVLSGGFNNSLLLCKRTGGDVVVSILYGGF